MSKYKTTLTLTLDRPIEEIGRRMLKRYISTALKNWGKGNLPAGDALHKAVLAIEVDNFKDTDLSKARAQGGHARAENLTPEQRSAAASHAAHARWDKEKK